MEIARNLEVHWDCICSIHPQIAKAERECGDNVLSEKGTVFEMCNGAIEK